MTRISDNMEKVTIPRNQETSRHINYHHQQHPALLWHQTQNHLKEPKITIATKKHKQKFNTKLTNNILKNCT